MRKRRRTSSPFVASLLLAVSGGPLAASGCSGDPRPLHFEEPSPPRPENTALCRSLCERGHCEGKALEACQSGCARPRNEDLDCEPSWARFLKCQDAATDLTCDEKGFVFTPACREVFRTVVDCELRPCTGCVPRRLTPPAGP